MDTYMSGYPSWLPRGMEESLWNAQCRAWSSFLDNSWQNKNGFAKLPFWTDSAVGGNSLYMIEAESQTPKLMMRKLMFRVSDDYLALNPTMLSPQRHLHYNKEFSLNSICGGEPLHLKSCNVFVIKCPFSLFFSMWQGPQVNVTNREECSGGQNIADVRAMHLQGVLPLNPCMGRTLAAG